MEFGPPWGKACLARRVKRPVSCSLSRRLVPVHRADHTPAAAIEDMGYRPSWCSGRDAPRVPAPSHDPPVPRRIRTSASQLNILHLEPDTPRSPARGPRPRGCLGPPAVWSAGYRGATELCAARARSAVLCESRPRHARETRTGADTAVPPSHRSPWPWPHNTRPRRGSARQDLHFVRGPRCGGPGT
jgi:hypothetical protein